MEINKEKIGSKITISLKTRFKEIRFYKLLYVSIHVYKYSSLYAYILTYITDILIGIDA